MVWLVEACEDLAGAFFEPFACGDELAEDPGAAGAFAVEAGEFLEFFIELSGFDVGGLGFFFALVEGEFEGFDFVLEGFDGFLELGFVGESGFAIGG